MNSTLGQTRPASRVPTWAIVALPLPAVVISNADVLFLAATSRGTGAGWLGLSLAITIPLSILASTVTMWFLLRLRREVDRRAKAEQDVRAALAE